MNNIGKNPWLGLNAYSEGSILYGRDNDTINLTQLVVYNSDAVLYGKSGIGKSSLLNAKLLPIIRHKGIIPLSVRLDHSANAQPYVLQIFNAIKESGITIKNVAKSISKIPLLWELFHCNIFLIEDKSVPLLIIFDQFEEIFTLQQNSKIRQEFFNEMADLINDVKPRAITKANDIAETITENEQNKNFEDFIDLDLNVPEEYRTEYVNDNDIHLLFSLREDFLSEFEYYTLVIPSLKQHRYGLRPINDKEACEIITIPGKDVLPLDEKERNELVVKIIESSKDGDLKQINTLILSLTCYLLYQKAQKRPDGRLSMEDFRQIGSNLLLDFYESLKLQPKARQVLEERLIDSNGRRNTANIEEIQDILPSWKELTDGDKRILQINSNNRIELVHDLLAQAIYSTHQRRQKRNKSRILKFYLLAIVILIFFIGLLGSVFTLSKNSTNTITQSKIVLNPDKQLQIPKGYYRTSKNTINDPYIETIVFEGGSIDIEHCYNLKRIEVTGNTTRIFIQNCPQLQHIEFRDSIIVGSLTLTECPNLKCLFLPEEINQIQSDQDLVIVPTLGSNNYKFKNGVLWDMIHSRIIYIHKDKLINALKNDKKIEFPFELYDRDSIKYSYNQWLYNEKQSEIDTQGCFVLKNDPQYIMGYSQPSKNLNLSDKMVANGTFENCKTLESVTINSKTSLTNHIFSGCTNLKKIKIKQDSTIKLTHIKNLLICLQELKQPIVYEITGKGPLAKTNEGIITYDSIPVLISAESPKAYDMKIKNDTTYLCTRGWFLSMNFTNNHDKVLSVNSAGQFNRTDLLQIPNLNQLYCKINPHYVNWFGGYYLDDSFIDGDLTANTKNQLYIFCKNLTAKQRTWYASSANMDFFDLAYSTKKDITLIVPYGKLKDFLYSDNASFIGFKEIKEASLGLTIWKNVQQTFNNVRFFLINTPFALFLLILGIIIVLSLFWYLNIKQINSNRISDHAVSKGFAEALAMVALAFLSWIATYWFCWFWILNTPENSIHAISICTTSGVVIALLVLFFMYKNVLYQLKHLRFRQVKTHIKVFLRQYKKSINRTLLASAVLIIVITVIVHVIYKRNAQISKANELLTLVNEEFRSYSNNKKKAALYALYKYLEAHKIPTKSIADSMYSLLHTQSHNLELDKDLINLEYPFGYTNYFSMALNPSGKLLSSIPYTLKIQVWNTKNKQLHNTINIHENKLISGSVGPIKWINDTIFITSYNHRLYYCTINNSLEINSTINIRSTVFEVMGNNLYYSIPGYQSKYLYVMSLQDKKFTNIDTIHIHNNRINDIHSYKGCIVTCSNDGTLKMYNPQTGGKSLLYKTNTSIRNLVVGAHDSMIAFNTSDSTYLIKESHHTKKIISQKKEDIDEICCIAPNGNWLITRKNKTAIAIDNSLSPQGGNIIAKDINPNKPIYLNPDGDKLYMFDNANCICIKNMNVPTIKTDSRNGLLQKILLNFIHEDFHLSNEDLIKYSPYIGLHDTISKK